MSTKSQSIKKIAIIGTAVVVTGVVVGSLFVFSDDPASKRIEQSKIVNKQTRPDNNSDNKDESYKLLLQEYNDINSQKALDTGTSYIGVPVNEKVDESTNTEKKYDWEKPTQNKPTNNNVQSSNNDRQREEVLKRKLALLTKIEDKRGATSENNAIFASASYGSVSGEGQNEWATSLFPEKNQENNINSVIAGGEAKSQTITAIGNGVLVCMLASVWTDEIGRASCRERV